MTEKRVMKLASRGKRFGAACIDAFVPVVSYLLYSAVMAANGLKIYNPGYGYGFGNDFGYGYGYDFGYGNGFGSHHLNGASAAIMFVVFIILLAYIVAQFILFARGKSIGKAILGLQVVSSTDGKPFRFWKMFFRECFVKSASGSVFGLGYIWILVDEKNRGWHDKILDSFVVDLKESERMNYRRHMEQARKAAPVPEPAPAPEPDIKEEISIPEAEPVIPEAEPVNPEEQTAEEPVVEVTPEVVIIEPEAAAPEPEEQPEEPELPELSMSMKKEELLEAARERGIQVSSRATKAAIIEAIEKAAEETETSVDEKDL
ncbi:MAG: RDD family protein [Mogibacterium sp.]|nr:RDD family protein [Mogibacterium sp.]MBQ6500397.1 RDD family protein [Mogibacterium sp.]